MKVLMLGILMTAATALAQEPSPAPPAAYQPIRVTFQVLDLDGRPLEGASIAARLDPASTRLPPDKEIKAKSGAEEFKYMAGEQMFPIFSTQQTTGPDGRCEVPFIVYSNRNDAIDYDLDGLYKEPNHQVLVSGDAHLSLTNGDDKRSIVVHANVRRQLALSILLGALAAWAGITIMGFLLFFRGMYRYWLSNGKPIDLARSLCWSGTILICMVGLGLVYWWMLPHIVGLWLFFSLLFAIWLLHLIVSMLARNRVAYSA